MFETLERKGNFKQFGYSGQPYPLINPSNKYG